jgi:adenosylcobinamide-phosphate synthase
MTDAAILTFAYILDLIIGDPRWLPHPVRIIGWGIEKMERALRSAEVRKRGSAEVKGKDLAEKLSGVLLVVVIVGMTYSIFYFVNSFLLTPNFSLLTSYFLLIFFTSTTFATNDLIKSGKTVIDAVNMGDKESAREKLGFIVGRDTGQLDNKGIAKATIETLAENTSDGIIAPLFYFAIGGLPLAMTYKAINTLDSMVGYRNEKYKNFGWAAARLDDIVNYIPARITGVLIVISSFILNLSLVTCHLSLKTMLRDGRKHLSPNSGIPEAAMAGALGVRLGGPSFYGGIIIEKPYIGEERSEVRSQKSEVKNQIPDHVYLDASENAFTIVKLTSLLGFGLVLILLYLRTNI